MVRSSLEGSGRVWLVSQLEMERVFDVHEKLAGSESEDSLLLGTSASRKKLRWKWENILVT